MKLGVMTAAFPDQSLEQVADWCAANGFESLEIACWPASGGEKRRYAGICHIDVETLDASGAREINELVTSRGLEISALAYYPNNLHPDPAARDEANSHLLRVIDAAQTLGVEVVGTFVGNDRAATPRANMQTFGEVFPALIDHARERGVKVAIENCPMIFSEDEWPGGNNLASSPAAWREMFRIVPWEGFGLNFDPSHLVWLMIDCDRAVREFADRIHHVHAKDLEIDRNGLYEHGVLSSGMGWQVPRLPGLGEVRFDRFFAALYAVGYDRWVSIEHEDRRFEGSDELVKRGFLIARDVLRPYLH